MYAHATHPTHTMTRRCGQKRLWPTCGDFTHTHSTNSLPLSLCLLLSARVLCMTERNGTLALTQKFAGGWSYVAKVTSCKTHIFK